VVVEAVVATPAQQQDKVRQGIVGKLRWAPMKDKMALPNPATVAVVAVVAVAGVVATAAQYPVVIKVALQVCMVVARVLVKIQMADFLAASELPTTAKVLQ
jgi:hypothetical protein